jgi:hyperosmotically inducible protein
MHIQSLLKSACRLVAIGAMSSLLAFAATAAEPKATADDMALAGKVKTALIDSPSTKANDINVEVNQGRVQLIGYVDSPEQKAAAGRIAAGVIGVTSVQNNLQVQQGPVADRSTGEVVDDGMVTAKVKAALIADGRTKAYQINVDTRQGIVQLGGFVDTAEAKAAASEVAKTVSGVKTVNNSLQVKAPK